MKKGLHVVGTSAALDYAGDLGDAALTLDAIGGLRSEPSEGQAVAKLAASPCTTAHARAQYQRDGFLGAKHVLPSPVLRSVTGEITALFERPVEDNILTDQPVIWCWRHQPGGKRSTFPLSAAPSVQRLATSGRLHDACRFLARTDYLQMFECVVFDKPPGVGEQFAWHNDQSYYPTDPPGHSISIWIALDRCDEENGAMSFARGSHRHGDVASVDVKTGKPMDPLAVANEIPDPVAAGYATELLVLDPGDGVFFDANVWHASPPNRSPTRRRRGLSIRFWTQPTRYAPGPGKQAMFMRQLRAAPGELITGGCFPIFRY
jgi:hypothetical protein